METKEEILNNLIKHTYSRRFHPSQESIFKDMYPEYYEEIIKWFPDNSIPFKTKLFHWLKDDPEMKIGHCPVCGKMCNPHPEIFRLEYHKHCSPTCAGNNPETREIQRQTNLKKYGKENLSEVKSIRDKAKKTCLERYGVEFYGKTQECKDRIKNTSLQRYGTEHYLKTPEMKKRKEETCLKKYGVKHYIQTDEAKEKVKQTSIKKFGVDNYAKTQEYTDKVKQTCLEKYGVEYYTQTEGFSKNHRKQISHDNLTFDSSWEVTVYDFCKEHNLNFEYQPNIQITYEFEGKTHFYHPDFLIEGQLYEVKGDHFFEEDKMINPFNREMDGLFEAKHQCILKNNIIMLRKEDIDNLNINMFIK